MERLNLPAFDYKIRITEEKKEIFDVVRRKYVQATPEEWVRQHFVNYLVTHLKYPRSLITTESGLLYNKLSKRADIKVYDRSGQPFMLVECKSPAVKLTQNVFNQASCYNHAFKAVYLAATNGLTHYCCKIDHKNASFSFMDKIPAFQDNVPPK